MDESGGAECDLKGCTEFDFLPQLCSGCGHRFCRHHAAASTHGCASLASDGRRVDVGEAEEKFARLEGTAGLPPAAIRACTQCGVASGFTVTECGLCKRFYCLEHRHHAQHAAHHAGRAARGSPDRSSRKAIAPPVMPGTTEAQPLTLARKDSSASVVRLNLALVTTSHSSAAESERGRSVAGPAATVACDAARAALYFADVGTSASLGKVVEDALAILLPDGAVASQKRPYVVPLVFPASDLAELVRSKRGADLDTLAVTRAFTCLNPVALSTTMRELVADPLDVLLLLLESSPRTDGSADCRCGVNPSESAALLRSLLYSVTRLKAKLALRRPTPQRSGPRSAGEQRAPDSLLASVEPEKKKPEGDAGIAAEKQLWFDDSDDPYVPPSGGLPLSLLTEARFLNTKTSPLAAAACQRDGASRKALVALYVFTAQGEPKRVAAPPRAWYVLLSAGWPMGRVLDIIVRECDLPQSHQWNIFHLQSLTRLAPSPLTAGSSTAPMPLLANGDALAAFPGPRLPQSLVAEVRRATALPPASSEAKQLRLRAMKNCVLM